MVSNQEQPFPKYKNGWGLEQHPYNGTWNYVKKEHKYLKFHSWPKPWNAVEKIDVLNCNEILVLRVQFMQDLVGEFLFDMVVPSPTELFRNWIFGQLRCGTKMGIKPRIPGLFDIFMKKEGRVVLAAIAAPIGVPLLMWSVAQTTIDAMNTWSSIINRQAMCTDPEAHGIMRGGHVHIQNEGSGGVPFYTKVYDPHNYCNELSGIFTGPGGMLHAWAAGSATNNNPAVTAQFGYRIFTGAGGENSWNDISIPPGGTAGLSLGGHNSDGATAQVQVRLLNDLPGVLAGVNVAITAFFFSTNPDDTERHFPDGPMKPDPSPYEYCQKVYGQ